MSLVCLDLAVAGADLSLFSKQKEIISQTDYCLINLSSKTYVFLERNNESSLSSKTYVSEDKLTKY